MATETAVVLLHGFNKGPKDMVSLSSAIRGRGYDVFTPHLPTLFGSLEDCVASLKIQLSSVSRNCDSVNIVAHSMGGLIAEQYLRFNPLGILGRRVYISSPFNGTRLAKIGCKIPFLGDVIQPLKSLAQGIEQPGTTGENEIGIIIGAKCDLLLGKILLAEKSDGRVEISSSKGISASDYLTLPYGHKKIHHSGECIDQVLFFLKNGKFNP